MIYLHRIFSPKLLVPLTLLTPYVFVLQYGVSALELLVFLALTLVLLPTVLFRQASIPAFLVAFLTLYSLGYLGALLNGIHWSVPVGVWNLNFFYKILLALGAFYISASYPHEIHTVLRSRLFLATLCVLGAVAIVYPFLSYDTKIQYFSILYRPGSDFEQYFTSRRMPGLGINANVYSFMLFSYLLFVFRNFIERTTSWLFPLLCFISILVLSSKTVIALSVAGCTAILAGHTLRRTRGSDASARRIFLNLRCAKLLSVFLILTLLSVFFAMYTQTGRTVVDSYATVQRFQALLEQTPDTEGEPTGLALRLTLWSRGLDRAELAPILGIARDPFNSLRGSLVGFYNPHNEFLRMWILYGICGLAAWVFLLAHLIQENLRHGKSIEWPAFYFGLIVFMLFDGGLDDPRIMVFTFLMVGMNYRSLKNWRALRVEQQVATGTSTGLPNPSSSPGSLAT